MAASSWRTAHGKSKKHGRLVASEAVPADELRAATGSDTAGRDRDSQGRFRKGNRAAAAKRIKAGHGGALAKLRAKGDPHAIAAMKWGRRYGSHRRAELAQLHGGEISAGVGAMVESASSLLALARYWEARSVADGDPDLAKLAASLISQARGCERDAWELASREAEARNKGEDSRLARYLRGDLENDR